MRIKSRVGAVILTLFCMAVMAAPVSAEILVQVTPDSVNFGQVKQGETVTAKFRLRNAGTNQLTILFLEFSVPDMSAHVKQKIDAGSSTEILLNWDTSRLSGEVKGEGILTLNDSQNSEIVFTLSGFVIATDIPSEPETPVKEEVLD